MGLGSAQKVSLDGLNDQVQTKKEEEREKEKGPSFLPLQGHWPYHAAL